MKKKVTIYLLVILFIVMKIRTEIKDNRTEGTLESQKEFEEGMIEISGEPYTDFNLEEFSISFESEELKKLFEKNGRIDYLKYTLYEYLYKSERGSCRNAIILKDYQDLETKISFVVQLADEAEPKFLNGTYQKNKDEFSFENVSKTPGRTNDYIEVEGGEK